ncbi:uncharacterized protein [Amphiura filiformis]|uniref:uncharacterized protein n=1 Tax=Amphiura filiformis TaxID=82378 RepID=UPI003B20FA1F
MRLVFLSRSLQHFSVYRNKITDFRPVLRHFSRYPPQQELTTATHNVNVTSSVIQPKSILPFSRTIFSHRIELVSKRPVSMASNSRDDELSIPEAKITKISANIERHDYYPQNEKRPTLLLLSWLSATPRALDRFRHIYASHGFNVVTVLSKPFHFIWPKSSEPLAQEICEYLISHTQGPIVVHGLSIGGFIYSYCLLHAMENKDVFDALENRIQGHIFDSLVVGELENMAEGVSKGSASYPTTRYVVQKVILLYFWLAHNHTIPHYDRAIEVFYNMPFRTPMLVYYSKIDTMCSNEAMENLTKTWREKYSLDVVPKVFDDTQHVFHLREHPEEYKEVLKNFLDKLNVHSDHFQVPSQL